MTNTLIFKEALGLDAHDPNYIPIAGELFVDQSTKELKIGDGIHTFNELPAIYNVSIPNNQTAMEIIENNLCLIDANEFNKLFDSISTVGMIQKVNDLLLQAGIDTSPYLSGIYKSLLKAEVEKIDFVLYL